MYIQVTLEECKKHFNNVYKAIPKDIRNSCDDDYVVRFDSLSGTMEIGYASDNFHLLK